MIDIEKMKAHATEVANDTTVCGNQIEREWAKTVLSLLSELEAREADRRDAALWRKWWEWAHRLNKKPFELARDCDSYALAQRQEGEEK
jgi:predicted nucleic acid-binding protein